MRIPIVGMLARSMGFVSYEMGSAWRPGEVVVNIAVAGKAGGAFLTIMADLLCSMAVERALQKIATCRIVVKILENVSITPVMVAVNSVTSIAWGRLTVDSVEHAQLGRSRDSVSVNAKRPKILIV